MIHILLAIVLLEMAAWLGLGLAEKYTGFVDAAHWQREARMNQWELSVCEKKLARRR